MKNPRLVALNWLIQVISHGRSVNELLATPTSISAQQLALSKQMLFGCLRYYHRLKTIADNLLEKPLKQKDNDLFLVILLGLYQLEYLSTPDHAAISESVDLTKNLRKKWASGLVNGVLRRFQREKRSIDATLLKSVQYQFSHPGWIVKKLRQDWPDLFEQILANNNQHAPMVLRVNTQKNSLSEYLEKLNNAEIKASPHLIAPDAIVLDKATDVFSLPGFTEGEVTVQDAAPQLVVDMLQLKEGLRVLDACAAPGGKTTHILQRQSQLKLTAVEMSPTRAVRIEQTLQRMNLDCDVVVADVANIESWWDGELFDRILLDVPCSASGVIRRNPDIKVHRKVTDIEPLVAIQQKILTQCWQLLKPGGLLVYATCSIFKVENQQQIALFSQSNSFELTGLPEALESLLDNQADIGYQILPGDAAMDGFYFCGLRKV